MKKNVVIKSTRLTEPLQLNTIIIAEFLGDAKNVFIVAKIKEINITQFEFFTKIVLIYLSFWTAS